MAALWALAPLAAILLGMGVLRRSAVVAGGVGLALAMVLAATVFAPAAPAVLPGLAAGVAAEAMHTTATILWIILPALAIYEFQNRTGAVGRIRDLLAALSDAPRVQVLLIAFFFGLFLEGAAGFGTPVALAAPLLVGLGHDPVRAVVLALLGHAAGVSFGAVGTPMLAQIDLAGLAPQPLGPMTVGLHVAAAPALLWALMRLAGDGPVRAAEAGWALLAALCFFVPAAALAQVAGPELPTLAGALVGAVAFVVLYRWRTGGGPLPVRGLGADLAPYLAIVGLVLASRLIGPVQAALAGLSLDWTLPGGFRGGFQPLYHPGTMLLLGLAGAALATGRGSALGPALAAALRRLAPVALALLVMLTLSRLMVHAGMIEALAAAATGAGGVWPLVAPLLGVLGTFITGSATASNILFSDLQVTIAGALSLPAPAMAAAQGFGAAIGNMVAPHNIIAGAATVGLVGREGDILARTALPCALCAGLGGAVLLIALI